MAAVYENCFLAFPRGRMNARFLFCLAIGAVALASSGCGEVRGRRKIQEGNRLYKDGEYKAAVAAFTEAEEFVPNFPVLWLNKGFTCQKMLIPGAHTPDNEAAATCALEAFKRFKDLKPADPRGDTLYVQTLFDAERYDELSKMFEQRLVRNPKDIDAVNGLIQVYTKANKTEEALTWYQKKAEIKADEPEAQYSVGVFLWQQLMQKGGGDKASFDPRPDPNKPKEKKEAPLFGMGDIVSQQRVDYADLGIEFLNKAVALKPKYPEAMTYLNLLYRQKSFAYFDQPEEWQKCVDEAVKWMKKSLELQGRSIPTAPPNPDQSEKGADEGKPDEAPPRGARPHKDTDKR